MNNRHWCWERMWAQWAWVYSRCDFLAQNWPLTRMTFVRGATSSWLSNPHRGINCWLSLGLIFEWNLSPATWKYVYGYSGCIQPCLLWFWNFLVPLCWMVSQLHEIIVCWILACFWGASSKQMQSHLLFHLQYVLKKDWGKLNLSFGCSSLPFPTHPLFYSCMCFIGSVVLKKITDRYWKP
jgi:hypothetical protein